MQRSRTGQKKRNNTRASKDTTSSSEVRVASPEFYSSTRIRQLFGSGCSRRPKSLTIFEHDLDYHTYEQLMWAESAGLAIDTETGGLDYRKDPLLLVQIIDKDGNVYLVRRPDFKSKYLIKTLKLPWQRLIFHHAAFDLKFLQANLGLMHSPEIQCTKTLIKIVYPQLKSGLAHSLRKVLQIIIDKDIDHSKWNCEKLSDEQVKYAVQDIIHLHKLHETLKKEAIRIGKYDTYRHAMNAILIKSRLDIEGYTDLLQYEKEDPEKIKAQIDWWKERQSVNS
jgi:ribonuclease D